MDNMIGIIWATKDDAATFLQRWNNGVFKSLTEGSMQEDDDVAVTISGVGKIKAALSTERLIIAYKPRIIINIGSCGLLNSTYNIFDIVNIKEVIEGDHFWSGTKVFPTILLNPIGDFIPKARLVTQDHPIESKDERDRWSKLADLCDMEGYAVAKTCMDHSISCHLVKGVTDEAGIGDVEGTKQFEKNIPVIATSLFKWIESFMKSIK